MKLPQNPDELLPVLGSFGVAIALGKLLASRQALTWRAVVGRAMEGAALAMSAGVVLLLPQLFPSWFGALKDVPAVALLGVGGLLASIGVSGALAAIRAWRGSK